MAIAEIKWKLVKDTYFFDTTTCYLSEDGNHMFYSGGEKRIKILIDDLNELVRKGCAMWLKLGEYDFALDKLSKCPTTTWYSINQMLYSLESWGVMKESKNSARKSLKEEKEVWIIKSKDDLQYVGKKIFDVCEDIENARKFKSKFEAEEFLKKHDKALDYRYWKVINIVSESKESVRKSIRESNRTKLDIIKDMVDLAYDVKQQSKMDKDSYFGNQPDSVINAKDDKVYEKFVDLAEKLKLHGWNQFIDYAYDLINEYENVIEESKKSARKSIKESVEFSKEKDIYIAQIKDSSISFAYTPINTDDDFNGYFVFDGDDVIEYLNWKGADADDMLKAFDDFEKAVKKYASKGDAKIIIKDFHDKLGI